MSVYPPPSEIVPIFNPEDYFITDDTLTKEYADRHYLKFPVAQGTETLQTTIVNGILTANAGVKTNSISAIGTIMDIGKSRMLGTLDMNLNAVNNVKDVFGESGFNIRLIAATGRAVEINSGFLDMAIGEIENVKKISYNSLMSPMTFEHQQFDGEFKYMIDGDDICYINSSGLNMNTYDITNCFQLSGPNNNNLKISALGTGHLQLWSGATPINRLSFRDTGECLANSNGLKIQGTTTATAIISIGNGSGITQGDGAIAIGGGSGLNQGADTIAIGKTCGTLQGINSICLGLLCGEVSQGTSSIAIGVASGRIQNNNCIAMGNSAGRNQGLSCVSIGTNAAFTSSGANSIAIGTDSGKSSGLRTVSIGALAGSTTQSNDCVAIGSNAGQTTQGLSSIAIGLNAGSTTQGLEAIAIGPTAGNSVQRRECVAIGKGAGTTDQGTGWVGSGDGSVAIGVSAGTTTQSFRSVAIGGASGTTTQGNSSVAIGYASGNLSQANNCVSIGAYSGQNNQKSGSVLIGTSCGVNSSLGATGTNSIYIGTSCGTTVVQSNSIVFSATGSAYNPGTAGFFVNPSNLNVVTNTATLTMNSTTGEITRTSSSLRYKKDIETLSKDTSILHQLQPKEFRFISECDTCSKSYGFIAEEIELIDRDLVGRNNEGQPEGIYWEKINTYTICEVQKLKKELDATKIELLELKTIVKLLIDEIKNPKPI
jgi:hypothetical protein